MAKEKSDEDMTSKGGGGEKKTNIMQCWGGTKALTKLQQVCTMHVCYHLCMDTFLCRAIAPLRLGFYHHKFDESLRCEWNIPFSKAVKSTEIPYPCMDVKTLHTSKKTAFWKQACWTAFCVLGRLFPSELRVMINQISKVMSWNCFKVHLRRTNL